MPNNNSRHHLLLKLAAILLLTICAIQSGVYAQNPANETGGDSTQAALSQNGQTEGIIILINSPPGGLARGETLRINWANLNDEDPDKRIIEPLRLAVKLFDANGRIIAQTAAQAVGAGKFQSLDFNRDIIHLPGEAGTGRLQIRCEIEIIGTTKYPDLVVHKQAVAPLVQTSLEIISNVGTTRLMGTTTVSFCGPKGCSRMTLGDSL